MGASCSRTKKTTSKSGGKRKFRGGRKTRTRRVRGGRKTRMRGGGCGCAANSSSSSLFGGYKYTRKASLAAEKRLSQRISRRVTKRVKRRKRRRGRKGRR